MNIIISGADGFIGGDLFEWLSKNKNAYRCIKAGRRQEDPENDYYHVDLSDRNSALAFADKIKGSGLIIDAFVHCASVMADAGNAKDMILLTRNIQLTENVIEIIELLGIKTIINLSSIAVYPNIDGVYDENSVIRPSKNGDGLYGLSKFCSEELFGFYLNPLGATVTNLRVAQVYGNRMRADRTFKIMENEMKEHHKITVWSNGERVSNFVSVDYVIAVIRHFLHHPINDTFNTGGENLSYTELAQKIIKLNGYSNVEICPVNKGVLAKIFINSDKLKKKLHEDIEPLPGLSEA